jgi:hypothetical protein
VANKQDELLNWPSASCIDRATYPAKNGGFRMEIRELKEMYEKKVESIENILEIRKSNREDFSNWRLVETEKLEGILFEAKNIRSILREMN